MGLASRGLRETDQGTEEVIDPQEVAQARRQARRVNLITVTVAAAATAALMLPS